MASPLQGSQPFIQPANINIPIQSGDLTEAIFRAGQLALQQRELQRQAIQGVSDTFLSMARLQQENIRTQLEHQVASAALEQKGTHKFYNPFMVKPGEAISGAEDIRPSFQGMGNVNLDSLDPDIGRLQELESDGLSTLHMQAVFAKHGSAGLKGNELLAKVNLGGPVDDPLTKTPKTAEDLKTAMDTRDDLASRLGQLTGRGSAKEITDVLRPYFGGDSLEDAGTLELKGELLHHIISNEINNRRKSLILKLELGQIGLHINPTKEY